MFHNNFVQISNYIETALHAVLQAGREILRVYESEDFDVSRKEDNSPLTLADRRAHEVIEAALVSTGIPRLSEEGADIPVDERQRWPRYWLIDPLDGTKEFIKRNGEFTVNIALMGPLNEDEPGAGYRPLAGVVYLPVQDLLYLGLEGRGAWKIPEASRLAEGGDVEGLFWEKIEARGQRLPLSGLPSSIEERPVAVVVSRSHNSPESEALVVELERRFGPVERVSSGSSIKLCLVAEGSADVYPRFAPTMEWDTAAGDSVCRAAGCSVTQRDETTPLFYNKTNLLNPWFLIKGPRVLDTGDQGWRR